MTISFCLDTIFLSPSLKIVFHAEMHVSSKLNNCVVSKQNYIEYRLYRKMTIYSNFSKWSFFLIIHILHFCLDTK